MAATATVRGITRSCRRVSSIPSSVKAVGQQRLRPEYTALNSRNAPGTASAARITLRKMLSSKPPNSVSHTVVSSPAKAASA